MKECCLMHFDTDTAEAQIEVTLRYQSEVRDVRNHQVGDSIVGIVYPRN